MKACRRNLYIGKNIRIWISMLLVLTLIITVIPCSSVLAVEDLTSLNNQEIDELAQGENATSGFTEGGEETEPGESGPDPEIP